MEDSVNGYFEVNFKKKITYAIGVKRLQKVQSSLVVCGCLQLRLNPSCEQLCAGQQSYTFGAVLTSLVGLFLVKTQVEEWRDGAELC